jgi:imidazolonepropionase-like amidohydrolase
MTGGHGWFMGVESDGQDEVVKAVRREIKAGADLIKFIATGGILTQGVKPSSAQLTYEELQAGIDEAHRAGLKTAAHAQGEPGITNAVKAGIDSVEHGYFLTEELAQIMLDKGIYLVPTITSTTNIIKFGTQAGIPDWAVEKAKRVVDAAQKSNELARAAGLKVAMGTDSGTPFNYHGKNGFELAAMVEWGYSPMEAIQAATSNAAALLGLEDSLGAIKANYLADLLVVEGNPLDHIGLLAPDCGIESVYKAGELIRECI